MKLKRILSALVATTMVLGGVAVNGSSILDSINFGITANAVEEVTGTVYKPTDWSQVYDLVNSANENDIIDVTDIQGVHAGRSIAINKSITIRGDATDPNTFSTKKVRYLEFSISRDSTLTIENLYIEHTALNESAVSGEGNIILKHSIISPRNNYDTATCYDAPPMINIEGDVSVVGTLVGEYWDASVSGADVLDRDGEFTGKAGTAISARNVTIDSALISGGSSFDDGVDGGDAIVATGKIVVYGKNTDSHAPYTHIYGGQGKNGGNALISAEGVIVNGGSILGGKGINETSGIGGSGIISGGDIELTGTKAYDSTAKSTYFDTYVLPGKGGYMPGVTIKFTDNTTESYKTRKLIMKTAMVKGVNQTGSNPAAPYIVEMGKNDIAIVDDSYIGWYINIPLFSNGYYKITNAFATWGTFDNATELSDTDIEMYSSPVTATATIPEPTYTVTIPATIDFGTQTQALAKYKNSAKDQYGNNVNVTTSFDVSATGVDNLFDDLGSLPQLNVSVAFSGKLNGTTNNANKVSYSGVDFVTGDTIAEFKNDADLASNEKNQVTKTLTLNRCDITAEDSYTDTMTFTISIPKDNE